MLGDSGIILIFAKNTSKDENGVAEITFAAFDVNTEFIGIVEAVDGLGAVGSQTFTIRVFKF